jgi:hypothetical protein
MINHAKCKGFYTSVEVHTIQSWVMVVKLLSTTSQKNLKVHTLVTNHRITINYKEINLMEFYSCHKITNEKHVFFEQI